MTSCNVTRTTGPVSTKSFRLDVRPPAAAGPNTTKRGVHDSPSLSHKAAIMAPKVRAAATGDNVALGPVVREGKASGFAGARACFRGLACLLHAVARRNMRHWLKRRISARLTGENCFGVCHIFASFNDTFVHVTDLRCDQCNRHCTLAPRQPNWLSREPRRALGAGSGR